MKYRRLSIRTKIVFFVIAAFLVITSNYEAMAKEYPSLHRGIRPLGMGGAFTAVADDENALFYNPAGIANISLLKLGIVNPLVEVSHNSIELVTDGTKEELDDTDKVADFLKKHVGKPQHIRAALFPHMGINIMSTGVMVGALGQATVDLAVRNPTFPEVHADVIGDVGVIAGAGAKIPFIGLRVGVAGKFIERKSLSKVYTAKDIVTFADDFEKTIEKDMKSGSGISADIGIIYDLPFMGLINGKLALVAQNVPEMKMGEAVDIKSQLNAGLSIKKSLLGFAVLGAIDYKDLTNNISKDKDIAKRLHVGAEVKLPIILSLRVGLNQGYYTAGATVSLLILKLDVATYGEEVGAYAGQKGDRRYVAQISLGW